MNVKVVSVLLLAFCGILIRQVAMIPKPSMYTEVGPDVIPAVITGALTILSVIYSILAFTGRLDKGDTPAEPPEVGSHTRLALFLGGGLFCILTIQIIGFLIPVTIAGVGVALAFDAPRTSKTPLVCSLIALSFWACFSLLIGIDLGPLFDFDISIFEGDE